MAEQIIIDHLRIVLAYIEQHTAITNRECRSATNLGYDSSIKIFNALVSIGVLRKTGDGSATKYVLPCPGKPSDRTISIDDLATVMDHVTQHGSVTVRECKQATGLAQAASTLVCRALCVLGMLRKAGQGAEVYYLPAGSRDSGPSRPGYHRKPYL